ncbi:hypothetical protein G6O69_32925 [Pseudenhygromyxa sp. WMMC2535]|uniref:hypothetical protein n=1 Tax=Pseudenhygromyxa sp. WMMC2535 TaxID=2712867 RepID=UPI001556679C|nr:hypothetical protein [Pseudenhygromyxa sp. WMMC2535]NVB42672.1 hypothetical protein [Pseudenhygromyxa sp. WMMC2535]
MRTNRLIIPCALSLLLLTTASSGCAETGPGTLEVEYTLGNNKACSDLGVSTVEALLVRGSGDEREVLYDRRTACGGALIIDDIEPQAYELEVYAYDSANVAILDNLSEATSARRVEIFDASDAVRDVDLTERPAELRVRWRLGEGGFSSCEGVGIDSFEIKAFREGGSGLILETTLDCELDGEGSGNWRVIDDPERELIGSTFGEVGIQALDASGTEIGASAAFIFDPVGAGYPVELTIECDENGCVPAE